MTFEGIGKIDTNKRTMLCPKCGAENLSWRSRCQTCGTLLHEEDEVTTVKYHRRDYLLLSALICGLIGAGAVAFFWWFVFAFAEGHITDPIGLLFMLGTGLFVLGSVAIASKWPLIGGGLLIVEGLAPIGFFVWSCIEYGFNFLGGGITLLNPGTGIPGFEGSIYALMMLVFWGGILLYLIPGLSLAASGVLFVLWRRKGQRASASRASPQGNRRQD